MALLLWVRHSHVPLTPEPWPMTKEGKDIVGRVANGLC